MSSPPWDRLLPRSCRAARRSYVGGRERAAVATDRRPIRRPRLAVHAGGVELGEEDVSEPELRLALDVAEGEPGDVDRAAVRGEVEVRLRERVGTVVLGR